MPSHASLKSLARYANTKQVLGYLVTALTATFWLAENVLGVSGVLGTVVFGVQTARTSFLAMDEHTHHANHAFWGEVGYVATSIIFILAGVKSRDKIDSFVENFAEDFQTENEKAQICAAIDDPVECLSHHACRWDWGAVEDAGICSLNMVHTADENFHVRNQLVLNLILWAILGLIRGLVVAMLSPMLRKIGYGLTLKEAVVMVWGGLRGAVSLSLALLVDGNHLIGDRARETIFLQTTGIVTLTLIINGTTSGMVYKWLQVYPPNPYRPALATQGLRNIQSEMMEKVIARISSHWFHANADVDTLVKLMPNFSDASLHDGDLVGVKTAPMRSAWMKSKDKLLKPATADDSAVGADGVVRILDHCATINFDVVSFEGADPAFCAHEAAPAASSRAPDTYGHIRLVAGKLVQSYDTPVARGKDCGYSPAWANDVASHDFSLPTDPNAPEAVQLYVNLLESTFVGQGDSIGECLIDVTDLCANGGGKTVHKTVELKSSMSSTHSPRSLKATIDSAATEAAVGTVSLAVSCTMSGVGKELKVSLLKGKLDPSLIGRALQRKSPRSREPRQKLASSEHSLGRSFSNESTGSFCGSVSSSPGHGHAHHGQHGDSHDDHGHGDHGHGPSNMDKLRNIKRWLEDSDPSIEHSFAMYDIMLNGMRTSFAHELEGKAISVEAYSKLNAAIGSGLDVNDAQMHQDRKVEDRASASFSFPAAASPLDAVVDYVLDYAENGLNPLWSGRNVQGQDTANATGSEFFSHRMLCAEMLLVLIDELSDLAAGMDTPDASLAKHHGRVLAGGGAATAAQHLSELGESFTLNALQCLQRCKRKLAQMQLAAPNTFRACHTLLAFNLVASEFHHRVHAYEDQGFFAKDMSTAAATEMQGRQRELAQFFSQSPLLVSFILPLAKATPILGERLRSHPIYYAFDADKCGPPAPRRATTGGSSCASNGNTLIVNPFVAAMRGTIESTWSQSSQNSTLPASSAPHDISHADGNVQQQQQQQQQPDKDDKNDHQVARSAPPPSSDEEAEEEADSSTISAHLNEPHLNEKNRRKSGASSGVWQDC